MPTHSRRLSRLPRRLVVGLAGFTLCALAADAGASSGASLRVTVFDYAALPADDLTLTLETVDRLLGLAGVSVQWVRCAPDGASPAPPACNGPLEQGGLGLRLLAAAPPASRPGVPLTLGYAVLDDTGAGVMASVYVDRIERLARESSVAPGQCGRSGGGPRARPFAAQDARSR